MRTFETVARLGSLVAAADVLNVTHGAVSKQIKALEADMGAPLFDRRNRGVHLTAQGRWLSERLAPLFSDLERTVADFHARLEHAGPLTISCEPTLCLRLLIPALGALKREHGLDVRVLAAGGPIDFSRDHCDLAIRRSDFAIPPNTTVQTLAREWTGPVLSPALDQSSIDSLPLLLSETRPDAWRDWMTRADIALTGPIIRYEHFYLALQAAEAGQGVALASIHMVAKEIADGRLQAPRGFLGDGTEYIALYPLAREDERIDIFVRWIKDLMAASSASAVAGQKIDASKH